jgi:lysyl-tRNA synthetase class 2
MSEENIGGEDSLIEERRKKLEILRSENKAYINNFYKENYATDLSTKYSQLTKKELEDQNISDISIAGRIVLRRVMGNASFATIRDPNLYK